jgi:hypothetical protein
MPFYLWVFAKTFAKVSYFRHKYFAKTKSEFSQKLSRKTKTFVPTLGQIEWIRISNFAGHPLWLVKLDVSPYGFIILDGSTPLTDPVLLGPCSIYNYVSQPLPSSSKKIFCFHLLYFPGQISFHGGGMKSIEI